MNTELHKYGTFDRNGVRVYSTLAIHPGEILKDEVEARGLKKHQLANALGMCPSYLSEIFAGKRKIPTAAALKLEKELGVDAGVWLRLQADYELTLARNAHESCHTKEKVVTSS